jgi:thioredoxin 1
MTIASLLLALCTAAPYTSSDAASPPVLLDFHADWCGPCQKMRPIVKQLKQNKFPVKSVDIDHDPDDLATRYRVQAVPTFVVVDGSGRELDRTKGTRTRSHEGHKFGRRIGALLQGRRSQGRVDSGTE